MTLLFNNTFSIHVVFYMWHSHVHTFTHVPYNVMSIHMYAHSPYMWYSTCGIHMYAHSHMFHTCTFMCTHRRHAITHNSQQLFFVVCLIMNLEPKLEHTTPCTGHMWSHVGHMWSHVILPMSGRSLVSSNLFSLLR